MTTQRILDQIEEWGRDLVNLGHTNRLLYFKPTKTTTLEIVGRTPDALLSGVTGAGRGWGFEIREQDEQLVPRSTSTVLTDRVDQRSLDSVLKGLDRKAQQEYNDKGLWTLYLALGLLTWTDPQDDREAQSPLVLVPVTVHRETPREPFTLNGVGEDVVYNPTLEIKLADEFGIVLPEPEEMERGTLADYFALVTKATALLKGRVEPRAVLATYSFHKEVMYRDIKDNAERIAEHPVIGALADPIDTTRESISFEPISDDRLDLDFPPEDLASVLPADASQRQCILSAKNGRSFVMDGPPGTGKSQTITNIIVELLRDGRTVLFVSEKAAALEVVRGRLAHVGLDEFVLELHSHKATRKEVATELGRSLEARVRAGAEVTSAIKGKARKHRAALNGYATAMNELRPQIGASLHDLLGQVGPLRDAPSLTGAPDLVAHLSPELLEELREQILTLSRAWGPAVQGQSFLWRDARGSRPRSRLLPELRQALARLHDAADILGSTTGLPLGSSVDAYRGTAALVEHLAEPIQIPPRWLSIADLKAVVAGTSQLGDFQATIGTLRTQVAPYVGHDTALVDHNEAPSAQAALTQLIGLGLARVSGFSISDTARSADSLRALGRRLAGIENQATDLGVRLGLSTTGLDLHRGGQLASLAQLARAQHKPLPTWLDSQVQEALHVAAQVLRGLVEEYRARERTLSGSFTKDVLGLDLEALERRFSQEHKGFKKLGKAYRADKKALLPASVSGKVNKDLIRNIGQAREWQALSRRLLEAERLHADVIGDTYYRSTETDFERLVSAMTVAERAVEIAGREASASGVLHKISMTGEADVSLAPAGADLERDIDALNADCLRELDWELPPLPIRELASTISTAAITLDNLARHQQVLVALRPGTSLGEACEVLTWLHELAAAELSFRGWETEWSAWIGPRYEGLSTDLAAVQQDLDWTARLRALCSAPLPPNAAEALLRVRPDRAAFADSFAVWDKLRHELLDLFTTHGASSVTDELGGTFEDVDELLELLDTNQVNIDEWQTFRDTMQSLASHGLSAALDELVSLRPGFEVVQPALERTILQSYIDFTLDQDPRLQTTRATDRDALVESFREADAAIVASAAASVVSALNQRRPRSGAGIASIIQREAEKKSRHMPVRKLINDTLVVTQELKPCFMMSPLTVSQFLTPDVTFDVVIFDEASQVLPADAINCIYRGSQLIVAGDQKQLPPTSFFMSQSADDSDEYDEQALDEFESILDLCKSSGGFPSLPLSWHYRSRHESLITFSNYSFYSGGLITFPGALEAGPDVGVEFFHVPDGIYRRGGPRDNPREAKAVADRVFHHAQAHPSLTCGVVALSETQAAAIELEIEARRRDHPELDDYFHDGRLDGFFVKNLETVQGDERDVIIFSVGYGPDENRKTLMNFGPINKQGGWRRLNVAATRARYRVELVSSLTAGDIRDSENPSVLHLRRYLDFAERGIAALALDLVGSLGDVESPFEEDVIGVIRSWGFDVVPQVGSAGYRIDMAVRHPAKPGQFALGIECDGVMYHSSKTARDRDRLREEVLQGLGWNLHRIWGTAWYRNRPAEEARLRQAIIESFDRGRPPKPTPMTATPAELEYVDLDEVPAWAVTYVTHAHQTRCHYEITDPLAQPHLIKAVVEIVQHEGPIHVDRLLRRIRDAWGVARSGARIRAGYDAALKAAINVHGLLQDGDFVATSDNFPGPVRTPDPSDDESRRRVDEVPPREVMVALVALVDDAHAIEREDLIVAVARIFGWGRVGADIRAVLEGCLTNCVSEGNLRLSGGMYTI